MGTSSGARIIKYLKYIQIGDTYNKKDYKMSQRSKHANNSEKKYFVKVSEEIYFLNTSVNDGRLFLIKKFDGFHMFLVGKGERMSGKIKNLCLKLKK